MPYDALFILILMCLSRENYRLQFEQKGFFFRVIEFDFKRGRGTFIQNPPASIHPPLVPGLNLRIF